MRLPGRLSAAIDVLTDVETRKRPVSEALKAWGLNNRFAGAGHPTPLAWAMTRRVRSCLRWL